MYRENRDPLRESRTRFPLNLLSKIMTLSDAGKVIDEITTPEIFDQPASQIHRFDAT